MRGASFQALARVVAMVVSAAGFELGVAGTALAQPTNQPIDTDGNGRFDRVIVDGDYNGDGVVNMQDLQDAARALTALDSEAKEIDVVGSHVYGVTGMPIPSELARWDLLELDSNTLLSCSVDSLLEGWDETVVENDGHVIGNRDIVQGNQRIIIRGCTIDGGQPTVSHRRPPLFRTAVYFDGCDDCVIVSSTLKNTFHACFYTRHGRSNYSVQNRYENCGDNFADLQGLTQGQPCIYGFAKSGRTTRGIHSYGDRFLGCGAPAFNLRREDATASISDVTFSDAVVEDTVVHARGIYWACFKLTGSTSSNVVSGITCRRTAGFITGYAGGAAGSYDEVDVLQNASITDVVMEDMRYEIIIGPWSTNVKVSGLEVSSSAGAALVIRPPNRGFELSDATLCGADGGILFDSASGSEAGAHPEDPAEITTIRDTDVICSDDDPIGWPPYDGIEIRGGAFQGMRLFDVGVSGITGDAVRVHNPAGLLGGEFGLAIRRRSFQGVVHAEDEALVRISGGMLERVVLADRATVELYGRDFVAREAGSPVLVGFGDISYGFDGRISGELADGSPLDIAALNGDEGSRIALRAAPEPRSVPALASGLVLLVGLARRRRRR